MEFKELDLLDLINGYMCAEKGKLTCIFCGESFEEDVIYESRSRFVNGNRAIKEHICDVHGSVFEVLIGLDKQICGLSDVQKQVLEGMFGEKDNKELSEEMGINITTVRTHKFNIQKMKREAKILLALLEHIENEELSLERKKIEQDAVEKYSSNRSDIVSQKSTSIANRLHPFFSSFEPK